MLCNRNCTAPHAKIDVTLREVFPVKRYSDRHEEILRLIRTRVTAAYYGSQAIEFYEVARAAS